MVYGIRYMTMKYEIRMALLWPVALPSTISVQFVFVSFRLVLFRFVSFVFRFSSSSWLFILLAREVFTSLSLRLTGPPSALGHCVWHLQGFGYGFGFGFGFCAGFGLKLPRQMSVS